MPVFPGCQRHNTARFRGGTCYRCAVPACQPLLRFVGTFCLCSGSHSTPGAGDGNRTRVTCLGSRQSAIDLHRHILRPGAAICLFTAPALPVFPGRQISMKVPPAGVEPTQRERKMQKASACPGRHIPALRRGYHQ